MHPADAGKTVTLPASCKDKQGMLLWIVCRPVWLQAPGNVGNVKTILIIKANNSLSLI